jgi:NADH pyrophosphatase NudC (nudix superfamily)
MEKHMPCSHCHFCGTPYQTNIVLRNEQCCDECGGINYNNARPVTVLLIPHENGGLYVVRRNIHPGFGQIALIGGFQERGESWQQAGAREAFEEVQIVIPEPEKNIRIIAAESVVDNCINLMFGLVRRGVSEVLDFTPSEEAQTRERYCVDTDEALAFPAHNSIADAYFDRVFDV